MNKDDKDSSWFAGATIVGFVIGLFLGIAFAAFAWHEQISTIFDTVVHMRAALTECEKQDAFKESQHKQIKLRIEQDAKAEYCRGVKVGK